MGKLILIVEDDPKSMKLTRDLLQASGYKTIVAADGEEGVKLARDEKPDLILMDIMMPKMDGYTACHILKRDPVTKAIPIVMLTALGYALNMKLSQDMGAAGYITKPFTSHDLLGAIDQLLPIC